MALSAEQKEKLRNARVERSKVVVKKEDGYTSEEVFGNYNKAKGRLFGTLGKIYKRLNYTRSGKTIEETKDQDGRMTIERLLLLSNKLTSYEFCQLQRKRIEKAKEVENVAPELLVPEGKLNDNGKVMLIASILMAVLVTPLIFLKSFILILISVFVWGIAQGGFWAMIFPVFSDVIDESVVKNEKREEGTYIGIQQFFGRIGLAIQIIIFTVVHSLTGL